MMGNSDSSEIGDVSLNVIDSFDLSTSFDLNEESIRRIVQDADDRLSQRRTLPENGKNGFHFIKRRPSLDFYDSHSPKLQPFPTSQRLSNYKRSHSESSVFRRRVLRESNKSKPNGRLSWVQTGKLRLDQLLRKSQVPKKKLVDTIQEVPKCAYCENGPTKSEWKEKLEKWAESLRHAIEIINREEKMRVFIQSLQNENFELKSQLNNMILECDEWKTKYDGYTNEISIERKRLEQATHLFCHHCMNNNHLDLSMNSLCHLLDLDNLTSELNTILNCERCCQTCRTIAGQLLRRLHF